MWETMVEGRTIHNYYDKIKPFLEKREESILKSLNVVDSTFSKNRKLFLPKEMNLALLHHTFYIIKRAAELNDVSMGENALKIWQLNREDLEHHIFKYKTKYFLIAKSENCKDYKLNQQFDSAAYSFDIDTFLADSTISDSGYFNKAFQLIEKTNLFFFLEIANSIIINDKWRTMEDSLDSYTLTPFPGTVYTDWTDAPLRYAESVLHESVHSLLNMWLIKEDPKINSNNLYYSPWRGIDRPSIGIAHGAFAFSIVYQFYKRLYENKGFNLLNDKQIKYCYNRMNYEFKRLLQIEEYFEDVLSNIESNEIGELIKTWYPNSNRFSIYKEG